MEQDVVEGGLTGYRHVCSTCLSSDRNLISINDAAESFEVFRLLMFDFNSDRVSQYVDPLADIEHLFCWECLAVMRRLWRFKRQVHSAQEHLRVLALSRGQNLDHTYMSQSLSPLEMVIKTDYDKIFVDYTNRDLWQSQFLVQSMESVKNEEFDVGQVVRDNIDLQAVELMDVPAMAALTEPVSSVMSHIVVDSGMLLPAPCASETGRRAQLEVAVDPHSLNKSAVISQRANPAVKCGYIADCMSETEMQAYREEEKQKVQYACAAYKCELCIVGFYSQQQVEDHFIAFHRAKPGLVPCKVCYVYVDEASLALHTERHYTRYICKLCGHIAPTDRQASQHVKSHSQSVESGVISIEPAKPRRRKKKGGASEPAAAAPGDLRKLLSKTTIEGYKCLECEMFFKTSRARKNHVARFHREGLQCDHCKKRFVNRTTLATHLRLHEGPLPREECPVCHKMVRSIQIKYHIQRHKNKMRYECAECQKIFSHLATYQAHLKYARAHASDEVFKFPCPMCNKGFPTKEQMQDHFNYQHLGKTQHKCPVCDKPIASRANVEKHMMRVHGEKKDKPRNHSCAHCGKSFTDKKALTQHEVIHSGERPLSCDICQQTFKQKASLYTHRKRVHKVYPQKRHVEYMDVKLE